MLNNNIKKLFAALALFMALLVSTACLGGDKIAGTWVGKSKSHGDWTGGSKVDNIMVCEIQKNGKSYVMNYHYLVLKDEGWSERNNQQGLGVTLNENLISVLVPGVSLNMTYVEKDKTIQAPPMGLNFDNVVLERDDNGKKLESLKNDLLNEYQELKNKKAK